MTEEQVSRLVKFASENGICTFTLTNVFHIAAKESNKLDIIRDYGTIVCEELRQLENEMNNKQIAWSYQI